MASLLLLTSACRRRLSSSKYYLCRCLFSSSVSSIPEPEPEPEPEQPPSSGAVSTVADSLFCREPDPTRSISTLFSFPNRSCARYAADHALRQLSKSLDTTDRCDLLDSFLHLASTEQDFASLLLSYGSASLPHKALSAFRHRFAAAAASLSSVSFNALLSAYVRSRCHKEFPHLFVSVCTKYSIAPDVVSYGLLVHALFRSNRSSDAFAALKQIRDDHGVVLTNQIYVLLLASLRSREKPEEVNQLWDDMVANGVRLDCTAYNVKVWYHAVRGEAERVLQLVHEMEASQDKRARPDTITYNYLIGCLCKADRVNDVKEVYTKMRMSNTKRCSPDATTFKHVLCCLCRCGDFEAGLQVYRDGLKDNKHFEEFRRKLMEGLLKEGKVEAAQEVRDKFGISFTSHGKERR